MLATKIPYAVWLDTDDEVISTVLAIYEQRAAEAKRRRKD
jgi:hypothetical protein